MKTTILALIVAVLAAIGTAACEESYEVLTCKSHIILSVPTLTGDITTEAVKAHQAKLMEGKTLEHRCEVDPGFAKEQAKIEDDEMTARRCMSNGVCRPQIKKPTVP